MKNKTNLEKLKEDVRNEWFWIMKLELIDRYSEAILKDKPRQWIKKFDDKGLYDEGWADGYNRALEEWEEEIRKGIK